MCVYVVDLNGWQKLDEFVLVELVYLDRIGVAVLSYKIVIDLEINLSKDIYLINFVNDICNTLNKFLTYKGIQNIE